MKKKVLFGFATLMLAVALIPVRVAAQQQLATLNHNGTITAHYGDSALFNALNSAVNGDIITLSPGSFTCPDIKKAVTIRGTGMAVDTLTGVLPTRLFSHVNPTIDVATDPSNSLYIEGVYFQVSEYVKFKKMKDPNFVKCYFKKVVCDSTAANIQNAQFINCVLAKGWVNPYDSTQTRYAAIGTKFINSVIMEYFEGPSAEQLINCIACIYPGNLTTKNITNSVLYGYDSRNGSSVSYGNPANVFYSIGVNSSNFSSPYGSVQYFNMSLGTGHGLYTYNQNNFAAIFKTFRGGTFNESFEFELLDSAYVATHLGSDGTQIGVYGGQAPFSPYVRLPHVGRITVAPRSNAEGILPVEIEIVDE